MENLQEFFEKNIFSKRCKKTADKLISELKKTEKQYEENELEMKKFRSATEALLRELAWEAFINGFSSGLMEQTGFSPKYGIKRIQKRISERRR